MKQTAYYEPRSVTEAVTILADYGERAKVIAGGTDVLVDVRYKDEPECLVNITRIPDLRSIREDRQHLRIGTLTTIRDIEMNALVRERMRALWDATHQFASIQIRNTATIGGNICRASPSGETLAPLLVLDASATIVDKYGERNVPLSDFFLGPGRTVAGTDALLTEIDIPLPSQQSRSTYLKHAVRGAMDIAMVGVAVMVTPESDGHAVNNVSIGLAAVAPTPVRAVRAEALLRGRALTNETIQEAARHAANDSKPITDHRASAGYRRWIVETLTRRGLIALTGETVA